MAYNSFIAHGTDVTAYTFSSAQRMRFWNIVMAIHTCDCIRTYTDRAVVEGERSGVVSYQCDHLNTQVETAVVTVPWLPWQLMK